MATETLHFSESAGGWVSRFSYTPDWFVRLNNNFYCIQNGNLFLQNDNENSLRNNFFGVQYNSEITTIFNDESGSDKIFKTLVTESDETWSAEIETNLTEGEIFSDEFESRESLKFAYIRQNENESDYNGLAVNGIGAIISFDTLNVEYGYIPEMVSVGDTLYQLTDLSDELEIGVISSINRDTKIISVASVVVTPIPGRFSYAKKNSRIESGNMVGRWMQVKLSNDSTLASEISGVRTEAVLSTGLK